MTAEEFITEWNNDESFVTVHTSGSTGTPKELRVEKSRMRASAVTTCNFLGLKPNDTALLCMPADYIAGKMMIVRSIVRNLHLDIIPPTGHPMADVDKPYSLAAMVPLQVYNSLNVAAERERLKRIRNLIIGGGSIDPDMEKRLSDFPNAVWSSYGMTETLSHIALRRISGSNASEWYTPFDGVDITVNSDDCLVISAPMVAAETLITNDIADMHADGKRFRILGRKDNVVCSGGIKIQIEELERKLCSHLNFPFLITKRPDAALGEAVVMLMEGKEIAKALEICTKILPKHHVPRNFITVDAIPLTPNGKPARAEAMKLAKEKLHI